MSGEKFQCRRCRQALFESTDLSHQHVVQTNCSLWYLRDDDDMLPWILKLIDEGNWSKGKLYCPHCEARIGAFDFLHMISCECGEETIPAVYVVKSKIDHIKPINMASLSNENGGDYNNDDQKNEIDNLQDPGNNQSDLTSSLPSSTSNSSTSTTHNSSNVIVSNTDDNVGLDKLDNHDFIDIKSLQNGVQHNLILDDECLFSHGKHWILDNDLYPSSSNENVDCEIELKTMTCGHEDVLTDSLLLVQLDEKEVIHSSEVSEDKHFYPATSVFENSSFNSEVSDGEDFILEPRTLNKLHHTSARSSGSPRAYFNSHKATPHVTNCLCCRSWYNQLLTRSDNRRRMNFECECNYLSRQRHEDFVNISYDASRNVRVCHHCQQNSRLVCRDLDLLFGVRDGGHEIHDDILEVQQELRNLQELIHNKEDSLSASLQRRARRHGRRHARIRANNSHTNLNAFPHSQFQPDECEEEFAEHTPCDIEEGAEFEVPDCYQCPVCLDVLFDPQSTPCSHVFCGPCLRQLHKVSQKKPMCPLCRQRIYSVQANPETEQDIKRLYPDIHRQRARIESRRPVNNHPLPSPSTVRFDSDVNESQSRLVHFFYVMRTCLIILFLLITFLLNGEERQEHRRYARHVRLFFYGLVALIFVCCGIGVGILFTVYAYDFMLFLVGFCLFYVIVVKFLVTYVTAP